MSVDPYVIQIPQKIADSNGNPSREFLDWLIYDNRFKHDLWQEVTKGTGESTDTLDEKSASLYSILSFLSKNDYSVYQVSSSHTTSGNEFIRVSASCTINLNPFPEHKEYVSVQPEGDFIVTISGSINGKNQLVMHKAYDLAKMSYDAEIDEWVIT